jgi:hypothetical protein
MANKVDTDTDELEASIDASAEQQLAMSAQFGSQAENVMNQLKVGAQERREDFQETILSGVNAPIEADAIAALTEDYDAILSGVQREASLAQQATLRNIEQQQAATQNYMEMMGAALPALEARLQAQIEAASRAGGGGGGGGGRGGGGLDPSMLFGDPNVDPMAGYPATREETADYDPSGENPYGEYWGMERTDEEKKALAKELGIDEATLFTDHGYETFADATTRNPDRAKWFFMTIAKEFGYDQAELEQAYADIWGTATTVSSTPGESEFPHWFLNKGVSMFTSLVADGMDPKIAHEYVSSSILGEMERQYWDKEKKFEPEKYNQWVADFKFLMSVEYNGMLLANNRPMDYEVSGMPGDPRSVYQVGNRMTPLDDEENFGTDDWDPDEDWYVDNPDVINARKREEDFIETREEVADDPLMRFRPPEEEPSPYLNPDREPWEEGQRLFDPAPLESFLRDRLTPAEPLEQRGPTYDIPSADYLGIGDEVADEALRDAIPENVDYSGIGEGYKPAPKGPTDSPYQIKQVDAATVSTPPKIQESSIDFSAPEIGDAIAAMQAQTSLMNRMNMPDFEQANDELALFLQQKEKEKKEAEAAAAAAAAIAAAQSKTKPKPKPKTANPQINSLIRLQQAAKENARKYANFRIF